MISHSDDPALPPSATVVVRMVAGRPAAIRRRFVAELTAVIATTLGVPPQNVLIYVHELEPTAVAVGGTLLDAASDRSVESQGA